MKIRQRWAVLVLLGGLAGCIGEPEVEDVRAQASAVTSLRCGQAVNGEFYRPSGIGVLIVSARIEDTYELRATPGQEVTLDFQAYYPAEFGVRITARDARSGAVLKKVEKDTADRTRITLDAAPSGWHRIVVEPLQSRARIYARFCDYDYGYGRGRNGGYGYGYGCDYKRDYGNIGSDGDGNSYRLTASCTCGVGCPCNASGRDGVCMEATDCGRAPTPGLCPGPEAIQCCTSPRVDPSPEPAPMPDPAAGPGPSCSAAQGWACDCTWYGARDGCDCGCGAYDPDCDAADQAVYGCGPTGRCGPDGMCVSEPEDSEGTSPTDGVPGTWSCDASYWSASDGCDCECGAPDPDCDDPDQTVYNCAEDQACNADGHCL